jgi:1-acyl-sn-glycerol-3-phosphate acyltransferase
MCGAMNKAMHWFYYFGRILMRVLLFLLASWQVEGRENVPLKGPLIVVCNHPNMADPPLIAVSVNRKTVFMAKEELFLHWFSRFCVRNFGAFPVRRGGLDRTSLKEAERWLKQGVAVVMFPEGKRSRTIQMEEAFPGSALIAARLCVPVLPVGITGTEKIKGRTWWLHRPRIKVNIGEPFQMPSVNGKLTRDELAQLTSFIMEHIAGVLPPEYRGIYSGGQNGKV